MRRLLFENSGTKNLKTFESCFFLIYIISGVAQIVGPSLEVCGNCWEMVGTETTVIWFVSEQLAVGSLLENGSLSKGMCTECRSISNSFRHF